MHMLLRADEESYNEEGINPTLRFHGERLKEETGLTWGDEDFNPSLVATQMRPYTILKTNDNDDEG